MLSNITFGISDISKNIGIPNVTIIKNKINAPSMDFRKINFDMSIVFVTTLLRLLSNDQKNIAPRINQLPKLSKLICKDSILKFVLSVKIPKNMKTIEILPFLPSFSLNRMEAKITVNIISEFDNTVASEAFVISSQEK